MVEGKPCDLPRKTLSKLFQPVTVTDIPKISHTPRGKELQLTWCYRAAFLLAQRHLQTLSCALLLLVSQLQK